MSNLIKDLLAYSRVISGAQEFRDIDLNRIFADITCDLQRLHESDKFEGTGIGLAVCKKIRLNYCDKFHIMLYFCF